MSKDKKTYDLPIKTKDTPGSKEELDEVLDSPTPEEVVIEETRETHDNLIEEFVDIVGRYYDCQTVHVRAGAYHLVSALMGMNVWVSGVDHGTPNPWIVLCSLPGITRRSTLHRIVRYVYKNALKKYLLETNQATAENVEAFIEISIIESGTVEGITEQIERGAKLGVKCFVITSPEFGAVLKRMSHPSDNGQTLAVFSKLKYGEGGKTALSGRSGNTTERILPAGIYVVIFAGMQEPEMYLSTAQSRQGTLRRIDLAYVKYNEVDMTKWKPPVELGREAIWKELKLYAEKLAKRAIEIYQKRNFVHDETGNEYLSLMFPFFEEIKNIAREVDNAIVTSPTNPTDYAIYLQGKWEHIVEYSAIHALACNNEVKTNSDRLNLILINEEDFSAGKKMYEDMTHNAEEMLTALSENSAPAITARLPIDRIYNIIFRAGEAGIERSKLLNYSKLKAQELEELLNTLALSNRIRIKKDVSGEAGRPSLNYVATEHVLPIN